jgi:RND family efflux transporter MFP subunit
VNAVDLKRCRNLLVLPLAVVLLMIGCSDLPSAPTTIAPAPTASVASDADPTLTPMLNSKTFVVQRGPVVRTLQFNGRVTSLEETPLHFRSTGYVEEVYIEQGDEVRVGDLLADLQTDVLENQIAQAELALTSAQQALADIENRREQQITLAELDLAVAQTAMEQAQLANSYAISQTELTLALAREALTRTQTLQLSYTGEVVVARVGLSRAQNAVNHAEIEYQEALDRPWEKPEGVAAYAASLQHARWDLEAARAQYNQAVANQEVNQGVYQHDVEMQQIAVDQAEVALAQLKAGPDPLLALAVQRAQTELDLLKAGGDPNSTSGTYQAQQALEQQARLNLEQLKAKLADTQIFAPVEGEVISLSLYPGQPVEAFRPVVVIADVSALEVSAELRSGDLEELSEGQPVTVTSTTDPNGTWTGSICRLPHPYGTAGAAASGNTPDTATRISLNGDSSQLGPGDLVRVLVIVEEQADTLWLPPEAVRSFQDQDFVMLRDGGSQRRVDVDLGVMVQDRVEILQGLAEGQVVVAP